MGNFEQTPAVSEEMVHSAWDGGEEQGADEEAQHTEDSAEAAGPSEETGGAQAEQEAGEEKADQPETFTLKNRDETRQVTRDELVSMAQKGWDYDHVREERDQLRQFRQEADPALQLVKTYAERNGMDIPQYLDFCRKQELLAQGVNEQTAQAQIALEKQQQAIREQTSEAEQARQRQEQLAQQARERTQARQRDMDAFLAAYPGVKGEDIPGEVWARVAAGESLVSAYTMHRNQKLEADLAAERQNKENAARSTGSRSTAGQETARSLIVRAWDEAE